MAIIPTLSTSILFCNLCYILSWISPHVWWKSPYGCSKFCNIDTHKKKLIHCVAIFTILYGNYYPPHGEFKLIFIEKFARRTWVNFTQQYGKNRQRCQENKFYYAVRQLLLFYYKEFPSKILSMKGRLLLDALFIYSFFIPARNLFNFWYRQYWVKVKILNGEVLE